MNEIIRVRDLSFNWGENQVLDGVNFSLKENELVAILGINGAGKSTLLKCINKILKYNKGKVLLMNEDIRKYNLADLSKKISYVPQSVLTSFSMDVFDVVLLGRRPHLTWRIGEKDREKVSETLRFFNLESFAFRKFNKLSGGERQRVVIAKAIAQDPNLFLMDEPTSDLDLKNQISVMKKIKQLVCNTDYSKSALIAIHDINIAARFADKILLLHEGRILAEGVPEEVLTTENIEKVFGVTSEVEVKTNNSPLRVIIKEEINEDEDE